MLEIQLTFEAIYLSFFENLVIILLILWIYAVIQYEAEKLPEKK